MMRFVAGCDGVRAKTRNGRSSTCSMAGEHTLKAIAATPANASGGKLRRSEGQRGEGMPRWLVALVWGAAALLTIWALLYYVGYYLGEVGD
jgi:hypothetical protein